MESTSEAQRRVEAAVEQYEARLLRYARRFTSDDATARDLVQFTFLKLCDRRSAEIDTRLPAWLFSVCRNRAREIGRKERRMETLTPLLEAKEASHEPSPYEAAEHHNSTACLQAAMQSLPEDQQEVLDLWSEGLSYREISQVVGREESHIRVQVHRAIRKLRSHPRVKAMLEEREVKIG